MFSFIEIFRSIGQQRNSVIQKKEKNNKYYLIKKLLQVHCNQAIYSLFNYSVAVEHNTKSPSR